MTTANTETVNAAPVRSGAWLGAVQITTPRRSHEKLGLVGVGGVLKHKPKALDLFCCAGGAAMGMHRAGFEVVGVDIAPQPLYPFEFRQGDALDADLTGFDFVWASPPCQAHSTLKHRTGREYECLIARTREKLMAWGGVWIIENVMGAPLRSPVRLCGSAFGLNVRRHRIFESNVLLRGVDCRHDEQPEPIDVSGTGARRKGARLDGKGGNSRKPLNLAQAHAAMGMDWTNRKEISQAIPPAFAEFLCAQVRVFLPGFEEYACPVFRRVNPSPRREGNTTMSYAAAGQKEVRMHADRHARRPASATGCIFHVQITPRAGSGMPLGVGGVS